jgi:predicted ATPase
MLSKVALRGYRSLRDIVLPLGQLTVVTGANGSGKSSFYRALRLLADCGRGEVIGSLAREVIGSLAREGGLQSARWARKLMSNRPVELELGYPADDFGYTIDLGLPVPAQSMFDRDPQIKRENVFARLGRGFDELTRGLESCRSVLTEHHHPPRRRHALGNFVRHLCG